MKETENSIKQILDSWRQNFNERSCPICGHDHTTGYYDKDNENEFIKEIERLNSK